METMISIKFRWYAIRNGSGSGNGNGLRERRNGNGRTATEWWKAGISGLPTYGRSRATDREMSTPPTYAPDVAWHPLTLPLPVVFESQGKKF